MRSALRKKFEDFSDYGLRGMHQFTHSQTKVYIYEDCIADTTREIKQWVEGLWSKDFKTQGQKNLGEKSEDGKDQQRLTQL